MDRWTFLAGRSSKQLSKMEVEVSHPMNRIVRNESSNSRHRNNELAQQ
jgi:hypothetical protein